MTAFSFRSLDLFGYEPVYTFPGYRTSVGAWASLLLAVAVFLRLTTTASDFVESEPIISENRMVFEDDLQDPFRLPKVGLVFKRTGWKPFYDPTYFRFQFQQGIAGRASNSSYVELGDQPCSFVDVHGRIIEDEVRCPGRHGEVLGSFFDDRFQFVRVSVLRCHNGTDADGRAVPGPCRTPAEIDELMWQGTITLIIAQEDLDIASTQPQTQLLMFKKQFTANVHATYDVLFTVRFVEVLPRAYFDKFDPNNNRKFVVHDGETVSFTDFRPEKVGKWNLADPSYVPQYAAFFLLLTDEKLEQERRFESVFSLMEKWGGSITFFYMIISLLASQWNKRGFGRQVRGLDLRDLTREQFSHFGRLVDKSFQVPKELHDVDTKPRQ